MFIAKWDGKFFFWCVAYRAKSTQHTQNELIAQFWKLNVALDMVGPD